jgi:CubicO group peptidase (beta-lactamase class C family)
LLPANARKEQIIARLEARLPQLMKEGNVPGLSLALLRDGQLVWQRGFGVKNAQTGDPVTVDTVYEAASLSKPVFTYAVLKLVESGKFDLDKPLTQYLPGQYDVGDDPRLNQITARHVLNHTTGFPNWRPRNGKLQIHFTPGSRFSYSGEGFVYLSKVIEHVTGDKLNDFVKQSVFDPLGMTRSSFVWQESYDTLKTYVHNSKGNPGGQNKLSPGTSNAAASLLTTAQDFGRFVAAILNGTGLKKETLKLMLTPQVNVRAGGANSINRPDAKIVPDVAWGLGWGLQTTGDGLAFWHWGDNGNSKAFIVAFPRQKVGIVFFANSSNGLSFVREIVDEAVGSDHPALAWINYESYKSPARTLLKNIETKGVEVALREYREWRKGRPSGEVLDEGRMNGLGYELLYSWKRPKDAIEVFKLNVEDYPQSFNVYDSLGEAYAVNGDTEPAIKNYERSIELNPNNTGGIEALKKLREGKPAGNGIAARVDEVFNQYDKPNSPGCALAVIKDGQIIYKRGYGMADLDHDIPIKPDSVFHVASVSKQFTAMAILLLAKQGKLSLDDDIRKYIPELRDFGPRITIRHLLHHTSGLRDQWNLLIMSGWRLSEDVVKDEDILDLVSRMKALNFNPGDQYAYSNTGYTLSAFIVKRVSGQSLREFCEANIFKPLGMTRTFFRDDHAVVVKNQAYAYVPAPNNTFRLSVPNYDTVGASSLLTTAEDLARWDQNFYDKRVGGDWVIEQMQTPGTLNDGSKINYALGLAVGKYKGLNIVEHSGGDAGYRSHLMRFPDRRFSVACLCNTGSNPALLSRRVADIYLADQLTLEPPKQTYGGEVKIPEEELKIKAGAYWESSIEETGRVNFDKGKLRVSAPGINGELTPLSSNRFRIAERSAEVEFETTGDGAVRRMLIKFEGNKPMIFDAMPPADKTPAKLAEFAGNYYSDEIDATYRIALKDDKLVLTRKKAPAVTLQPSFRDAFSTLSILGTVRFTRDGEGRVNGFRISAGRIRGFNFVKRSE